jgi:hypothetical protein
MKIAELVVGEDEAVEEGGEVVGGAIFIERRAEPRFGYGTTHENSRALHWYIVLHRPSVRPLDGFGSLEIKLGVSVYEVAGLVLEDVVDLGVHL